MSIKSFKTTIQTNDNAGAEIKANAKYVVGIDLGTTHCVVTYCELKSISVENQSDTIKSKAINGESSISLFEIDQLVGAGEIAARPYLPSFRYHPAPGEIEPKDQVLPWSNNPSATCLSGELPNAIVGEWARELNAKVDGRGVVSAKSWLSHPSVDREAAILPWSAAEGVEKVSPVLASASYLQHIKNAWSQRFSEHPLEKQELIVTVPASFDEAARSLTLRAAKMAGLTNILLLEEPQAVVYDWLYRHQLDTTVQLKNSKLILVCDLGGGTTDLSLVRVNLSGEKIELERVAVGDHLMLGGDNVDLAIAHQAERQVTKGGKKLTASALSQLIQQSRQAKEALLASNPQETATITVLGSGSKLIGGARKALVERSTVHKLVLDGFFPLSAFEEQPQIRKSGVVEFGLNYVSDPAISKHIAAFLNRHQSICRQVLQCSDEQRAIPDTILFNGGVFKSALIVERVMALFESWTNEIPSVLDNDRPDQAVAYGATAYGLARRGLHTKISGGSARSYFLFVDQQGGERKAVCILPKGTEEGERITLDNRQFSLKLGQPVLFNLVTTVGDIIYSPGELVSVDDKDFVALPPLVTVLKNRDQHHNQKEIAVVIVATMTAVGTIRVQCVGSKQGGVDTWDLEFQLRSMQEVKKTSAPEGVLPGKFPDAIDRIFEVYGKSDKAADKSAVKDLRAQLEKMLGKKAEWDTILLRALAKEIYEGAKRRRRSNHHERLWNNLMGFCLRPGFGHPLDDWQVNQLWSCYQQGVQFSNESQSWAEWWTLWRRVAGGLSEEAQRKIYKDISKYINPSTARNQKVVQELKTRSYEDIVRLAAVLEHLPVESKIELGDWLTKRLKKSKEPDATWWALGRIGSRVPFHGSAHKVVNKEIAQNWLELLLHQDWLKNKTAALAACMIARRCGDRARDLDDFFRKKVIDKLTEYKCSASWVTMVEQVAELGDKDKQSFFGESLPSGLYLIE